jgi:glycosyltransferase involved in cell wall biosynthesis
VLRRGKAQRRNGERCRAVGVAVGVFGVKIAHVVTRLAGGGTERNLAACLEIEVDDGHDVAVICGTVSAAYRRQVPEDVEFIEVTSLQRNPSFKSDFAAWREMRSVLSSGGYDVVHSHQAKAGALARMAIKSRNNTLVVHTVHMASFGAGYSRASSLLYKNIERYCARRTDFLCFVGVELKSDYAAAGIEGKHGSVVLRSSLDVDKFLAARRHRDGAVPASADRIGPSPAVLMVGALELRKRHALAIHALGDDLRRGRLQLVIAGDGPEQAKIVELLAQLDVRDSVRLLGHVSNVDELLAASDVLLHVSTAEGVPQVVVQALMAGVPVVATDVQGLREIDDADITIGRRDGSDLSSSLWARLQISRPAMPAEQFQEWHPSSVATSYGAFVRRLEDNLPRVVRRTYGH